MKRLILCLFLCGCCTSKYMAPDAPIEPSLKHPELMDPDDKKALADFYKKYFIFRAKYKEFLGS